MRLEYFPYKINDSTLEYLNIFSYIPPTFFRFVILKVCLLYDFLQFIYAFIYFDKHLPVGNFNQMFQNIHNDDDDDEEQKSV